MQSIEFTVEEQRLLIPLNFDIEVDGRAYLLYSRITKLQGEYIVGRFHDDDEAGYWEKDDTFTNLKDAIDYCIINDN